MRLGQGSRSHRAQPGVTLRQAVALDLPSFQPIQTHKIRHGMSDMQKDELLRQVSGLKRRRSIPTNILTTKNIDLFANVARKRLRDGDNAFRKRFLQLYVKRVEVHDDEVRISGSKSALVHGISEKTKPGTTGVPSFVMDWWAETETGQRKNVPRPCLRGAGVPTERRSIISPKRPHPLPCLCALS